MTKKETSTIGKIENKNYGIIAFTINFINSFNDSLKNFFNNSKKKTLLIVFGIVALLAIVVISIFLKK